MLEDPGVNRSRKSIYDWDANSICSQTQVIRITEQEFWLNAAGDPETHDILHVPLVSTTPTARTEIFLRELSQTHDVGTAVVLVDYART